MEILKEEVLNEVVGGMVVPRTDPLTIGDRARLIAEGYVHGLCKGLSGIRHGLAVCRNDITPDSCYRMSKADNEMVADNEALMLNGCGYIAGGGTILGLAVYGAYKLGEKIVKKIL